MQQIAFIVCFLSQILYASFIEKEAIVHFSGDFFFSRGPQPKRGKFIVDPTLKEVWFQQGLNTQKLEGVIPDSLFKLLSTEEVEFKEGSRIRTGHLSGLQLSLNLWESDVRFPKIPRIWDVKNQPLAMVEYLEWNPQSLSWVENSQEVEATTLLYPRTFRKPELAALESHPLRPVGILVLQQVASGILFIFHSDLYDTKVPFRVYRAHPHQITYFSNSIDPENLTRILEHAPASELRNSFETVEDFNPSTLFKKQSWFSTLVSSCWHALVRTATPTMKYSR